MLCAAAVAMIGAACVPIGGPQSNRRPARSACGAPARVGGARELGWIMQHAVLMPGTSKVLFFEDGAGAGTLDVNTGQIGCRNAPPYNMFCAGQTVLADGRIYVIGGDAR